MLFSRTALPQRDNSSQNGKASENVQLYFKTRSPSREWNVESRRKAEQNGHASEQDTPSDPSQALPHLKTDDKTNP